MRVLSNFKWVKKKKNQFLALSWTKQSNYDKTQNSTSVFSILRKTIEPYLERQKNSAREWFAHAVSGSESVGERERERKEHAWSFPGMMKGFGWCWVERVKWIIGWRFVVSYGSYFGTFQKTIPNQQTKNRSSFGVKSGRHHLAPYTFYVILCIILIYYFLINIFY